jgi:hypothetical protein
MIANAVIAYWEDKTDAMQVHKAILVALPKKGDLSELYINISKKMEQMRRTFNHQ